VSAIVLAVGKLLLLPFQGTPPTVFLLGLSDCVLTALISFAAWRAAHRSRAFARLLWLSVSVASALWAISFGRVAFSSVSISFRDALNVLWPITYIFYFVAAAFVVPLLLNEDREKRGIGWLQALDIAQLGIIASSAYLVFFYIPINTQLSEPLRIRYFMILHLMRDGFLALGYLYRGWRSRFRDLRQLHFRLAAFFAAYMVPTSLYVHATLVWHWPQPLVGFVADLPPVFLLTTAVSWRQQDDAIRQVEKPERRQEMLWAQLFPLLMPISVIVLASRVSTQYLRVAWIAVASSFVCYAARLFLMQRHQDTILTELSTLAEKFSKVFKSSPASIIITRLSDGKFIEVNDHCLEALKLTREEAIGRTALELGIFKTVEEREKLVSILRKRGSVRGVPLKFTLGGRMLDTLVSAEVIELEGEPLIIASILDVTQLKSVTEQLQQAQKMELIGSLAGGVAHDFNNLLTIIKSYSELAWKRNLKGELAEEIRQIREATDRAAGLTQQLLAFSRRQILQPRNICLNAVLSPIEDLLRRTLGENIELVTSFTADLGTVYVDPVQVEQVVMNLAVNARDAMPTGGKLLFETKNLELSSPYPQKGFEIPAGSYVMLAVTDTGTGIKPDHLDRIFEPFFTTKEVGSGTGLGLSTVHGIVSQSGGWISVYSEVGLGTTFNVWLPRVDSPAETFKPTDTEPQNLSGTETVLVVDDDHRVCELTANILGQYGYRVMTSNSGDDALQRACEFEDEIHLLVTDVVMPGTGGSELARRLKARRPGLKVLYMSGYPHSLRGARDVMEFRELTLAKPFAPTDLAREARRTLNAPSPLSLQTASTRATEEYAFEVFHDIN
jgi:PAS domain S-box-containing protein